eukprot:GHVT01029941.1.p1 GENE.GHVT01029941.1~~GHVT01029941.1.p1  ORF type:complete len:304 (+),score=11.18 GHVT01029941.1:6709-7620(+)
MSDVQKLGSSQPAVARFRLNRPITYKGEPAPISFVIHKIIEIVRSAQRPMVSHEVEVRLRELGFNGADIFFVKDLYEALQSNNRIILDEDQQRITYSNPYDSIDSAQSLLARVNLEGHLTGLRVTEDLLETNADMRHWIHELLSSRRIRCVRPNSSNVRGKTRCRFVGTPKACELYAAAKCQECFDNVKDLLLYRLGEAEYENARHNVDPDIKKLWNSIEIPKLDDILKEYNVKEPSGLSHTKSASARRKRTEDSSRFKRGRHRMRRIQNVHLFTAEELRQDIQNQQAMGLGATDAIDMSNFR